MFGSDAWWAAARSHHRDLQLEAERERLARRVVVRRSTWLAGLRRWLGGRLIDLGRMLASAPPGAATSPEVPARAGGASSS